MYADILNACITIVWRFLVAIVLLVLTYDFLMSKLTAVLLRDQMLTKFELTVATWACGMMKDKREYFN